MVSEKEVTKRIIDIKGQTFDSKKLYKALKEKITGLGYVFLEVNHQKKDTKYGKELKFEFKGVKKFDEFAMAELKVEITLENLNPVKVNNETLDECDGSIKITGKIQTDYKNEWTNTEFKQKLFKIYNKYFIKPKVKKRYIEPTTNDVEELNKIAKENIGYYYKY